jgi:hypothetical protein
MLTDAILKLIEDESLRLQFGRTGRERFEQFFSPQALGARTLEYYRHVAECWDSSGELVWRGQALDSHRHPSTQIVWVAELGSLCMLAEAGPARTIWYGPYLPLSAGTYRAEFVCWIGEQDATEDTCICTVDVLNMDGNFLNEKQILKADLHSRRGWIADIFFTVDGLAGGGFEFRVSTSGVVDLYVREIKVRQWPPRRGLAEAQASPFRWESRPAEPTGARSEPDTSRGLS